MNTGKYGMTHEYPGTPCKGGMDDTLALSG
jgi:hypothetical protein